MTSYSDEIRKIIIPPFIFKRSIYAALFIFVLLLISFIFMISNSKLEFSDLNHDGDVDWNEVFVAWALPSRYQWWKYVTGIVFMTWSAAVIHAVWKFDKSTRNHII